MRAVLPLLALGLAFLPLQGASACPPLPPGSVPPTEQERLNGFVSGATDIVYGIVIGPEFASNRTRLKILHVYRGTSRKGDTMEAVPSWDFPIPYCAGMMAPPPAKPVGTYGLFAFRNGTLGLSFIPPEHVQTMIREGWIVSAQARQ
jgi:hypothetical protein